MKKKIPSLSLQLKKYAKNANASSSRLSRLRRELKSLGASFQIIEATKFPDITEDANKIQRDNRKKAEANRIDYPDEFTLESVKERLDAYDLKTLPNYWALADVMVMLCIRPAELTTLRITDAGVTGYAKNRGQPDILENLDLWKRIKNEPKNYSLGFSVLYHLDEWVIQVSQELNGSIDS